MQIFKIFRNIRFSRNGHEPPGFTPELGKPTIELNTLFCLGSVVCQFFNNFYENFGCIPRTISRFWESTCPNSIPDYFRISRNSRINRNVKTYRPSDLLYFNPANSTYLYYVFIAPPVFRFIGYCMSKWTNRSQVLQTTGDRCPAERLFEKRNA